MIKPNFFIVGAPKCGTTAMNDYLNQHPDIFMGKKELHYFGKDLKSKVKLSEPEYLKHFQQAGGKKIIGEASVWYLFSKTAAKEIKEFVPDAKILIMLRNPVDVIYSLHSQHLYDGNEDILDFERAVGLDEERKKGINIPNSVDYFELPPYKDSVLFSSQVKRYLNIFGKENVHIIFYEDFVENTKKIVTETLDFLRVDSKIKIQYKVVNANKAIRFFSLHRLLKTPAGWLKKIVRIVIPFKGIRHGLMRFLFKWNVRTKKREQMNDHLYNTLREKVAEDVNELSKIVDRDLSGWFE